MYRTAMTVSAVALALSLVANVLLLMVMYRVKTTETHMLRTVNHMSELADIIEGQQQLLKSRSELLNY